MNTFTFGFISGAITTVLISSVITTDTLFPLLTGVSAGIFLIIPGLKYLSNSKDYSKLREILKSLLEGKEPYKPPKPLK